MAFFDEYPPHQTPSWFFPDGTRLLIETAVRGDIEKQNCSVMPRYWYIDAVIRCRQCDDHFVFSAAEQKLWYEDYFFWVCAYAVRCLKCRRQIHDVKVLRQQYDSAIAETLQGGDIEAKSRILGVIDQLEAEMNVLPQRMIENRQNLKRQTERRKQPEG
jgi:hypothetical protein